MNSSRMIRAQDSQEQWRKDVPVEHEDEFRNLPVKSRILHESGARREKKKQTNVQILLLCIQSKSANYLLIIVAAQHWNNSKIHLEVECKAMIVEKDGLRYGVVTLSNPTRNKAKGTKRATRKFSDQRFTQDRVLVSRSLPLT